MYPMMVCNTAQSSALSQAKLGMKGSHFIASLQCVASQVGIGLLVRTIDFIFV